MRTILIVVVVLALALVLWLAFGPSARAGEREKVNFAKPLPLGNAPLPPGVLEVPYAKTPVTVLSSSGAPVTVEVPSGVAGKITGVILPATKVEGLAQPYTVRPEIFKRGIN